MRLPVRTRFPADRLLYERDHVADTHREKHWVDFPNDFLNPVSLARGYTPVDGLQAETLLKHSACVLKLICGRYS
jgi:hypothetical protein